jgi:secondary thiamine-phosphate synthase enzyme
MAVTHQLFELETEARVHFFDITDIVEEKLQKMELKDGVLLVYTQHTTCSVQIQELSDDQTENGTELIMQDLLDVFAKLIPDFSSGANYLHPSQNHLDIAARERGEENAWCYNTDGHLRSIVMGRSVTVPIIDGRLELGEFGRIFFADWDQTRGRTRRIYVSVLT